MVFNPKHWLCERSHLGYLQLNPIWHPWFTINQICCVLAGSLEANGGKSSELKMTPDNFLQYLNYSWRQITKITETVVLTEQWLTFPTVFAPTCFNYHQVLLRASVCLMTRRVWGKQNMNVRNLVCLSEKVQCDDFCNTKWTLKLTDAKHKGGTFLMKLFGNNMSALTNSHEDTLIRQGVFIPVQVLLNNTE